MVKKPFDSLKAYSNGRMIFLDLETNKYLISKSEVGEFTSEDKRIEYCSKLRDNLQWPEKIIPGYGELLHFYHSLFVAWKYKNASLKIQLQILASGRKTKRNTSYDDIIRYSTLYQYLRNFLLRRRLCLEDSVCCFLFLSHYITPLELVIGVKQPPFAAHAWVQSGHLILNDKKIAVEDYSVILRYAE
ncbi:MAG: lasso peptide biosynthesis B2 protein [Pantoea sp.]|uniref:lasso peptide biosynthesis B2 protein n=1 Tax=Pantoea sp. TaxID=69393 RepID=UPI0039E4EE66